MEINPATYLIGRDKTSYPCDGDPIKDRLFVAQRLDDTTMVDRRFYHCTFANISFKDVELKKCEFLDCAFLNCYFRRSQMHDCKFVGCKFYGCEFPKISVQACDFKYSRFSGCVIPYAEMEHNLPSEPNLREELTGILAHASEMLGLTKEARGYRLQSIYARENHLWAAVRAASSWYKDHYPGMRRFGALFMFLVSKANGILWGYGERWVVLLRNLLLMTFGFFPLLLWIFRKGLQSSGQSYIGIGDILWLSLGTMLPVNGITEVVATSALTRTILAAEVFCGIVIAGLFVTFLFRAVVRR
jgi:hypothetical protein